MSGGWGVATLVSFLLLVSFLSPSFVSSSAFVPRHFSSFFFHPRQICVPFALQSQPSVAVFFFCLLALGLSSSPLPLLSSSSFQPHRLFPPDSVRCARSPSSDPHEREIKKKRNKFRVDWSRGIAVPPMMNDSTQQWPFFEMK